MKPLFTAEAISKGGRSGTIQTPDGLLDVALGSSLQKGIEKRGPNPELLFAGAYSACYHGAQVNAGKKLGTSVKDSTVRPLVSLVQDDHSALSPGGGSTRATPRHQSRTSSIHHGGSTPYVPLFQSSARRHFRQAGGGLNRTCLITDYRKRLTNPDEYPENRP